MHKILSDSQRLGHERRKDPSLNELAYSFFKTYIISNEVLPHLEFQSNIK